MPSPPDLPCSRSEKLFSSSQRAHVTFFVKRDKLEIAFWLLCSMHADIMLSCRCLPAEMEWWVAVTVVAILSQPAENTAFGGEEAVVLDMKE